MVLTIELIMFCEYGCRCWVVFAESGKLNTWGSTTELGQCYLISGKQQVSARYDEHLHEVDLFLLFFQV